MDDYNSHSKKDKTKVLMTTGSLMKVESIAECLEHSAILLTCIKRYMVLKNFFALFWSGRFTQVLLQLFFYG